MDPAVVREAMALARLRAVDEAAARGDSSVQAFYQDAVVFLTGGSGFLGKQLIEKLFRSCDIKRMYLLVRQKKGQSPQERISKIFKDSVFDTLRKRKPGFEERVRAVQGDVTELKLGISDEDRQLLSNEVSVIFHMAATIAFDEPLRAAVRTNVRGTIQALQLGKECKQLRSFVHVSTAYCHATASRIGGTVDEDFYDSPASPNTIVDLVEHLSEEKLAAIKPELIKDWPNTYAYTKALAEEAVRTMSGDLPICIVRPAIVISSSLEPNPGWVDLSSVFGPSGILLGTGLGVTHTFMANSDSCMDLIPVDLVINGTIAAGWATARRRAAPRNHVKIYTLTTTRNSITWRRIVDIMYTEATHYASPKAVWYSFHMHTKLHWLFLLLTWLLHYIPGYLADGVLRLLGKKPKVIKIYQLAFKLSTVLSFYTCNEFRFKDDNLRHLYDSLSTTGESIYITRGPIPLDSQVMPDVSDRSGEDDVVLTGLSGRLPESDNIEEFARQLFAGEDLVTADGRRWMPGLYGLPERCGKLKDLAHFDATFFGVHAKQAELMDPQLRLLLEVTHEALVDAGLNPAELRGSRTGVYVGGSNSDTLHLNADINGYALTGCSSCMFPNRISYTFDLKGPSLAIDTGCSSSMGALVQAANAIRAGQCDAAIVAGANLCLRPHCSLSLHRFRMLSPEGRCAAFDSSASGYVRSEAVVAVLLQRKRNARRLYCTVRGARVNNDGYKEQGITYPSGAMQSRLAVETFEEAKLNPADVAYVEAHGTGTEVGDPEEVNAIAELFCKNRQTPLLLGSVKSNMGHSEPVCGLCSIAKVVVAMESGVIPGNLHFKSPNNNIPALSDGRIKVVDQNTPWQGGLVVLNSFGFGGANAHVILESRGGARPPSAEYPAPRLVLASGRTREAVEQLLELAAKHQRDAELHALIDAVHSRAIPGHPHRGYAVLDPSRDAPPVIDILESDREPRPVWFIFSGMGSQCPGVGRTLLRLPSFAASVARSAATLEPYGVDLVHLITEAPVVAFDDAINSFVSISAVQVALVDVLYELGVRPDGIIGSSFGEIGCAYADGALSAEQALLCAYWRGRSVVEAKLAPGAMAVVGVPWEKIKGRCPADVECVCIHFIDNILIAGSPASIDKVAAELTAEGVFTKRVDSVGVAFHSKLVADAAPLLHASLLQVIPKPKPRSTRWLSTSVPHDQWDSQDRGKLCDAAYFVNNLLSPVQFSTVMAMVPERALVVEVAPQALMQALLRGALPGAKHVPLLRREAPDALSHLLCAVGQAYAAGVQPQVSRLYPSVSWPVSRGTPALASHVGWDHSEEWSVAQFSDCSTSENVIEYDLGKPDDAYIAGHKIDGKILFPAAGYLNLVRCTLANMNNLKMEETAVVLEQVKFRQATVITRDVPARFFISLLGGTGEFEISESGTVVVTGVARLANDANVEHLATEVLDEIDETPDDIPPLEAEDIYKQLRLRGLNYHGVFRGIRSSNARGTRGLINWDHNWISFMDSMIQYVYIGDTNCDHRLPVSLQRVVIDPVAQRSMTIQVGAVPINVCRSVDVVTAGGVEIRGLKRSIVTRRSNTQTMPRLDKCVFIPLLEARLESEDTERSKVDALTAALQLTIENSGVFKLNLTELVLQMSSETPLLSYAVQLLETEPHVYVAATLVAGADAPQHVAAMEPLGIKVSHEDAASGGLEANCHVVLCRDALARQDMLATLAAASSVRGSVVLEERMGALDDSAAQALVHRAGLELVSRVRTSSCEYLLLRRAITLPTARVLLEVPEDDEYSWVETLKTAMKRAESEDMRVYLWSRAPDSGLLGLATCLRREPGGDRLRFYYLPGAENAFDPDAPEYRDQVQRDLVINVLRAGVWGTYRHLLLDDTTSAIRQVEHAYVNTLTRGDLSSLRWIESGLRHAAATQRAGTDLCRVYYAPLNFRDVMIATGTLPPDALPVHLAGQECILGLEFSGRSSTGKRVMGIVAARGLATTVLADGGFMWDVPSQWSLEEAATVPMAYATAYYALAVRGRMRRGESVLVHAGAGGVGQAAIAVALHAGCTVFTTVGTPDKRAFLRERFPRLPDANVGNSRDCSFERLVLRRTCGRGVDLVLNSLAGDKLQASLRCLAAGGRFLEIGKLDLSDDSSLGMAVLLKNTTMYGIQLDALFDGDHHDKAEVVRRVTEGIASGVVRPLPATVYTDSQLEQAFRYMVTGKHIGKVLIRVREEEASSAPAPTRLISATPRTYMHPAKSYLLVGGLGGVGLELGSWLASRGARALVFNSRSGVRTGYQAWCIWRWRSAGVRVLVSTTDATTAAGARALLEEAAAAAPVGGIFNLAAVLRVGYLENLTPEDFFVSAKPKINATGALDAASRELAPELDYFVAFSSVASGRGERGMSAYGLANSAMERICERRRADGLPALAVQWGAIADVGMIINYYGLDDREVGSTKPQRITSCLEILDALLASRHAVAAAMVVEKRRTKDRLPQDLMSTVANILGIKNASGVAPTATLVELGLDSLMTTEIKQTLERSLDVFLSERETRLLTFARLRALGGVSGVTTAEKQWACTVQTTFDT